jgi:hypothetical protein
MIRPSHGPHRGCGRWLPGPTPHATPLAPLGRRRGEADVVIGPRRRVLSQGASTCSPAAPSPCVYHSACPRAGTHIAVIATLVAVDHTTARPPASTLCLAAPRVFDVPVEVLSHDARNSTEVVSRNLSCSDAAPHGALGNVQLLGYLPDAKKAPARVTSWPTHCCCP